MRVTTTIKERLQSNIERRERLLETTLWRPLKKAETIEQEYLQLEAKTLEQMLTQTRTSIWDKLFSRARLWTQASTDALQKVHTTTSQGREQLSV